MSLGKLRVLCNNEKLEGELAMRKRGQHDRKSEKPKDNGSMNDVPPTDERLEAYRLAK